jgi:hypothetical protein
MRVVVVAVAAAATHRSFWVMDQSSNIYSSEFGRALLAPLPHNALVLVMTDLATNSMRYVQAVDRYRADVFVLDQNLMSTDWFMPNHAKHFFGVSFPSIKYWPSDPLGYDMKEFLDGNFGRFRIFVFPHFKDNSALEGGYSLIPFGYMEEVVRRQGDGQSTPWTFKPLEWLNGVRDHLPPCAVHIQHFRRQVSAGFLGIQTSGGFCCVHEQVWNRHHESCGVASGGCCTPRSQRLHACIVDWPRRNLGWLPQYVQGDSSCLHAYLGAKFHVYIFRISGMLVFMEFCICPANHSTLCPPGSGSSVQSTCSACMRATTNGCFRFRWDRFGRGCESSRRRF